MRVRIAALRLEVTARMAASALIAAALMLCGVQPASRANSQPVVSASASLVAPKEIRVGMWTLRQDREVRLEPAAGASMRPCRQCPAHLMKGPATAVAEADSVVFTSGRPPVRTSEIRLEGGVTLKAHGESETLQFPVVITARAGVLVIAVSMPVEAYVQRVVASESGAADSAESLKALAVVVRSFALHVSHGHADYDVCDSTHCQLLRWRADAARVSAAEPAVLSTAGETLWFKGQRATAYFHKDCGGRTASPAEVWPRAKPAAYLPSRVDRYCTAEGGRAWAAELTRAELTAALNAGGVAAPGWQHVTVARRGESGRAVTLRLDQREVAAEDFRLAVGKALGWNRIPSTWFEVSQQGDRFVFHGRGWGHGVGLCQTGAAAMSAQGLSARQILEQYFPGAEADDEATGRAWMSFAGTGFTLECLSADDAVYVSAIAQARADAARVSGLHAPDSFTVRAFASTPAFRAATLEPGWVAAFTRDNWIATQPLRTLSARRLLAATMRHEFLHALVEREAGPRASLWLREGLVEAWTRPDTPPTRAAAEQTPALKLETIDTALAHSGSEQESEAAHRAAGWYAARLLELYGRAQMLNWLRTGLPDGVLSQAGFR